MKLDVHLSPGTWPTLCSGLMLVLILGGCGTAPKGHPSNSAVPSRLSAEQANDVTIYAVSLVGTPYRYGGNTPESGFDCSGLVGHIYKTRVNIVPPRTTSLLQDWGQPVPGDQIRSGDLVLFSLGAVPNHAGIYVGSSRFVHAPSTGGEVRIDDLKSKYWSRQRVAFRRP